MPRPSTRALLLSCSTAALACAVSTHTLAQTLTWDGSTGNWNTDASWLAGGTEPTAADDAYINAGTVTVSLLGEVSDELRLGNTAGSSSLNFNLGQLTTNIGRIGYLAGSTGTVNLAGAGSSWTDTAFVQVGFNGEGNLTIANDGMLTNPVAAVGVFNGSTGIVNVNTNGQWVNNGFLRVGEFGDGTVNIASGGVVDNTLGTIGHNAGSSGTVTVGGTDSIWNNTSGLYIGGSDTTTGGFGTLNINTGGTVNVTGGPLKLWAGGTVNLDGYGDGRRHRLGMEQHRTPSCRWRLRFSTRGERHAQHQ